MAGFDWVWSKSHTAGAIQIDQSKRKVFFSPDYSSGTVAARGEGPLNPKRNHYWELKMTLPVYGTDIVSL